MDFIKTIEEKILKQTISTLFGLVVALCCAVGLGLLGLLPQNISNKPEIVLIAELSLLLILSWFLMIPCIISLKRKLNKKPDFSQFIHDPNKQCWIHKNTGQRICEACKSENKLTPLSKFGSGWKCPLHPNVVVDCHTTNEISPSDMGELIPTIDP